MRKKIKNNSNRVVRKERIRKKIQGTPDKPRLRVFRSLKHFEAQLINDFENKTLVSLSTRDKSFDQKLSNYGNIKAAAQLGEIFAKKAVDKGYSSVVFDRGGYLYHGRIKAFADSARGAGLKF